MLDTGVLGSEGMSVPMFEKMSEWFSSVVEVNDAREDETGECDVVLRLPECGKFWALGCRWTVLAVEWVVALVMEVLGLALEVV